MKIDIKPFSVNDAWQGRRYRTDTYKRFKRDLTLMLPSIKIDSKAYLRLDITFGFSSSGSDIDNPLKPFIDVITVNYKFNDNRITELNIKKVLVKKGKEFIDFELKELTINLKQ